MKLGWLPVAALLAVLAFWVQCSFGANIPEIVTARERFSIPFRADAAELQRLQAGQVHLYVSQDQGQNWQVAQTITVEQSEFQFASPTDGTYWFAVALQGADGRLHPDPFTNPPGLKVIVDRQPPDLGLQLRAIAPNQVELSWRTADPSAVIETLELEYRNSPSEGWKTVYVTKKSTGRTSWKIQPGQTPEVRGRLADRAGNIKEQSAVLVESPATGLAGNTGHSVPNKGLQVRPVMGDPAPPPFLPLISPAEKKEKSNAALNLPPEPIRSHSAATPERPVSNFPPITPPINAFLPETDRVQVSSWDQHISPQLAPGQSQPAPQRTTQPRNAGKVSQDRSELQGNAGANSRVRYLNSHEFQIEYQVTGTGPSGVGVVELFVTQDDGREWFRYGVDSDLVSPMTVKVPADGKYGFHFRIHSGVGNADPPPQPGQAPQIQVVVDSTPPKIQLLNCYQGHGAQINTLTVQWDFVDEHPGDRPITLFLSEHRNGPWQQMGGPLEQTGSHTLTIPENAPARLFVKVRASDAAGNQAEAISAEPVLIDLSRPSAQIITIDTIR